MKEKFELKGTKVRSSWMRASLPNPAVIIGPAGIVDIIWITEPSGLPTFALN